MDELPLEAPAADRAIGTLGIRAGAVTIVAAAGAIYATREGALLLAPLLISVLLAYALEPFVALGLRCRLPRAAAVVVVYTLLIAGFAGLGLMAKRQVGAFVDSLPETVRGIQETIERARADATPSPQPGRIEQVQHAATDLEAAINSATPKPDSDVKRVTPVAPPFNVQASLAHASVALASGATRLAAIALLTLLLLLGGEALKRKVIGLAGPRAQKKLTRDVIKAIDRQIERYLVARVMISAFVAAATWLGLWALGVRDALVLGLVAGVLNVLPFIGPGVAIALVALVAFVQFHAIGMTAAAGGLAAVVAAIEGNVISPWLTGRAGELNTVAVFVSVLFWGWMWDVWGLVLAIPIMVAVKAAADHIEPLQPLGELLGR